jgi:lambda repressor-like predicted transcriptional regulator
MAKRKQYTKEDIAKAISEVKSGLSIRSVAYKFGIPSSTLHNHLKGKYKKVGAGGPTVLTYAEERDIVEV